jgi:hypothetical protein
MVKEIVGPFTLGITKHILELTDCAALVVSLREPNDCEGFVTGWGPPVDATRVGGLPFWEDHQARFVDVPVKGCSGLF